MVLLFSERFSQCNCITNTTYSLSKIAHFFKKDCLLLKQTVKNSVHLNDKRDLSRKNHKSAVVAAPENVKETLSILEFFRRHYR